MEAFLKEHPFAYPVALVDVYKPPAGFRRRRAGLPMTYLIAPDGKVAKQFLGPVEHGRARSALVGAPAGGRRGAMSGARFLVDGQACRACGSAPPPANARWRCSCAATRATSPTAASRCSPSATDDGARRTRALAVAGTAAGEGRPRCSAQPLDGWRRPRGLRHRLSRAQNLLLIGLTTWYCSRPGLPFSFGKSSFVGGTVRVGKAVEQVADQVEPAAALVVELHHRPRRRAWCAWRRTCARARGCTRRTCRATSGRSATASSA